MPKKSVGTKNKSGIFLAERGQRDAGQKRQARRAEKSAIRGGGAAPPRPADAQAAERAHAELLPLLGHRPEAVHGGRGDVRRREEVRRRQVASHKIQRDAAVFQHRRRLRDPRHLQEGRRGNLRALGRPARRRELVPQAQPVRGGALRLAEGRYRVQAVREIRRVPGGRAQEGVHALQHRVGRKAEQLLRDEVLRDSHVLQGLYGAREVLRRLGRVQRGGPREELVLLVLDIRAQEALHDWRGAVQAHAELRQESHKRAHRRAEPENPGVRLPGAGRQEEQLPAVRHHGLYLLGDRRLRGRREVAVRGGAS